MSQISNIVSIAADLLRGGGGLQANIDALTSADDLPSVSISPQQVITHNLPADIAEHSAAVRYPNVLVYCEKIMNQLREKFRTFSGQAALIIELRVSGDRVGDVDAQINLLVDAVTSTLDQNRGDWGGGMFYGGAYEVGFAAIKHGGKNFMQVVKISFPLEISKN